MDAKYVVTDSFHGTIFSILFNKPFIAIANDTRGVTRFISLLKMFNLEERLIKQGGNIDYESLVNKPIDFNKVKEVLAIEKEKSLNFIKVNL
jgi:exopolysaccharide biosynthesis predicted pyruvyltransferase EpsI